MKRTWQWSAPLLAVLALGAVAACSAEDDGLDGRALPGDGEGELAGGDVGEDGPLEGADDSITPASGGVGDGGVTPAAAAQKLRVTSNLNLRDQPSTAGTILRVIPAGSVVTVLPGGLVTGFYNVEHDGVAGWASAMYLEPEGTAAPTPAGGAPDLDGPPSPANAIARAKPAVGFSYWWGGGAWKAEGPSASTKGSCSGGCPSCTHRGSFGADCSGLIAKAWQQGNKNLEVNSHPFGTIHYVTPRAGQWSGVSRAALKPADALVYNSGGAGHIVLYEKGDGWGSPTVYECKGCAAGCVYNARTFGAAYKGIRREGF